MTSLTIPWHCLRDIFHTITFRFEENYKELRVGFVGQFCLTNLQRMRRYTGDMHRDQITTGIVTLCFVSTCAPICVSQRQ
jgi:hypothetical protein